MTLPIADAGIVLVPPFRFDIGGPCFSRLESATALRFYLMYFNRICSILFSIPRIPVNYITPDEQLLLEQGIISSAGPRISDIEFLCADFVAMEVTSILEKVRNDTEKPWALGQPRSVSNSMIGDTLNTLVMTLRDVLPSPTPDVPISEVISFREENRDSLRALHNSVDLTFVSLCEQGDPRIDLIRFDLLDRLSEIENLIQTAKFPYIKGEVSIGRAVGALAMGVVSELIATGAGIPIGLAKMIGDSISFTAKKSKISKLDNVCPRNFEYIFDARKSKVVFPQMCQIEYDLNIRGLSIRNSKVQFAHTAHAIPYVNIGSMAVSGSILL